MLKPGFMLPPLTFSDEEIEAIVLGSRWVAKQPDSRLSSAAVNALAKIASVLPDDLREDLDATTLLVGPPAPTVESIDLGLVRQAIRNERKLDFSIAMPAARGRGAWCGRSRLASSTRCGSWWRGAKCGRISGIFAPTA